MLRQFQDYEKSLTRRRNSEPARSYLWAVELPNLAVAPASGGKSKSLRAAESDASNAIEPVNLQLLNSLVTSFNAPIFSFETDKVTDGNTFWYRATHNDISNISMTIEEQQDGIVWKYLNSWKNLITHSNGGYNPPSYYKRDIVFYRLDMSKRTFQTFTYSNYFISEVSDVSNDYNSDEAVTYTVSFTGDSLVSVDTISKSDLDRRMEQVSNVLGGTEIPFDRFNYSGIPTPTIQNLLGTIAGRVI